MKKMTRKEFDKSREPYWPMLKREMKGKCSSENYAAAVSLALLSDIHTMLEHLIVEPEDSE